MSSFPEVLRTTKSAYIKPIKQGGIYSLKLKPLQSEILHPFLNFPKNSKNSNQSADLNKQKTSRIQTNHTARRHNRNFSLANLNRNAISSQTQRPSRPSSRILTSRPLTNSIKPEACGAQLQIINTEIDNNPEKMMTPVVQTLTQRINQFIKIAQKLDDQFFEVVVERCETHSAMLRMHETIEQKFQQCRKDVLAQFQKFRAVLSVCRRQSAMGIKVNKFQVEALQEDMENIGQVMDQLDNRSRKLYTACLNH